MRSRARAKYYTLTALSIKSEETDYFEGLDSQQNGFTQQGLKMRTKINTNKKMLPSLHSFPHFTMKSDMSISLLSQKTKK